MRTAARRRSAERGTSSEELVTAGARGRSSAYDARVNAFTVVLATRRSRPPAPRTDSRADRTGRRCSAYRSSVKDHIWLARGAGHQRVGRAARLRARRSTRCPWRGCEAAGAVVRRQDQQPGVLLPRVHRQRRVRPHPQPVGTRPHARRVERRRRRLRRLRRDPDRARHGRRWLDPHPGRLLRRGRAQADVRSGPEAAGVPRLAEPVRGRAADPHRARRRPGARGDGRGRARGRPAPGRCRLPAYRPRSPDRSSGPACGSRCPRTSAGLRSRRWCVALPAGGRPARPTTARRSSRRHPRRRTRPGCGTTSHFPRGSPPRGRCCRRTATLMTAGTRDIVEAGRYRHRARDYLDALERRRDLHGAPGRSSSTHHDVLLTPSMPLPAFGVGRHRAGHDRRQSGRPVLRRLVRARAAGQPHRTAGLRRADRPRPRRPAGGHAGHRAALVRRPGARRRRRVGAAGAVGRPVAGPAGVTAAATGVASRAARAGRPGPGRAR